MSEPPAKHHQTETYEIRVRGHLSARWAVELGVPNLTNESDGTTILRGIAADQAALHGLLHRIRDLGLTLIAVSRAGPDFSPLSPSSETRNPK